MEPNDTARKLSPVASGNRSCPVCGENRVTTLFHRERFEYGSGDAAVGLFVDLPVRICKACGFEFLDHEGERLKHEAVCRHLGVLTSAEILAVRERYGMTRSSFANVTGLGEATLNRWENGVVIQNLANDRYLRLLSIPHVMSTLNELVIRQDTEHEEITEKGHQFRVIKVTDTQRRQQASFRLRRAS